MSLALFISWALIILHYERQKLKNYCIIHYSSVWVFCFLLHPYFATLIYFRFFLQNECSFNHVMIRSFVFNMHDFFDIVSGQEPQYIYQDSKLLWVFHPIFVSRFGWQSLRKTKILSNSLFVCFLFSIFVLPVLPCKQKTSYRRMLLLGRVVVNACGVLTYL